MSLIPEWMIKGLYGGPAISKLAKSLFDISKDHNIEISDSDIISPTDGKTISFQNLPTNLQFY